MSENSFTIADVLSQAQQGELRNAVRQPVAQPSEQAAEGGREVEPEEDEGLAREGEELESDEGEEEAEYESEEDSIEAPEHWSREEKERFNELDARGRQLVLDMEKAAVQRLNPKMELAAKERKEAAQIKQEYAQLGEQMNMERQALVMALQADILDEHQLLEHFGDDFKALNQARLQNEQRKQALGQTLQHIQAQQQQQIVQLLERSRKVLEAEAPELLTESSRNQLKSYLLNSGFNEHEIAQVYDHRHMIMAEKARKYDELVSAKEVARKDAKSKKPPKLMAKQASAKVKGNLDNARDTKAAWDNLRKTGSREDAAKLFEMRLRKQ